jgi:hypothetical protein
MVAILLLIIAAAIFAAWASLRQYLEKKSFPQELKGWKKIKKKYFNFTLLLIFFAALCAGTASVLQNLHNTEVSRRNDELQKKLTSYIFGSDETPAFTASLIGNKVVLLIANPDKDFPIYNVRAKCQETFYPDIGTLYPSVHRTLEETDIAKFSKGPVYFVIWYNNTKAFEADIELQKRADSSLALKITYLDEHNKEFVPSWKRRADTATRSLDTAVYQPRLHF